MENNDSNLKPQSVGGLKLMTVFVVVLALHVVVIGSICTYYLLKGGNSDADVLADKLHKSLTPTSDSMTSNDNTTSDTADKSLSLPANPTDTTGTSSTSAPGTMVVNDSSSTIVNPSETPITPAAPTDVTPPSAPAITTASNSSASSQVASVTPGSSTTASAVPATPNPLAPPADPTSASMTAPAAAAISATVATTYVVKQGDVLEKIAHRNHLSVAKLKAANNLNANSILHIGQKLTIPAATPATAVATTTPVVSSDKATLAPVATAPEPKVKTASSLTQKKPKTAIAATTAKPGYYTVVKGDNLTKIAHKFKTTPSAIMTANNLSDPKKLSIGEKLKIPSKEARSVKSVEPSDKPVQGQANAVPTVTPVPVVTQLANNVVQ